MDAQFIRLAAQYRLPNSTVSKVLAEVSARMRMPCPAHKVGVLGAVEVVLTRAGFVKNPGFSDVPTRECKTCKRAVRVLPSGALTDHQGGSGRCPSSGYNLLLEAVQNAAREGFLNAKPARTGKKKKKKQAGVPGGLTGVPAPGRIRHAKTQNDRSLYLTSGAHSVVGGLPTLGKNR